MKRIFSSFISVLLCCNVFAQIQANNWTFGDSVGLCFSTAPPSFFLSSINVRETCAAISDSDGELLFYSNGENVWNGNNEIMPNGDSIHIGGIDILGGSSYTQGVTIIPKPGSETNYYLLHMSGPTVPDDTIGLEYTLIDMDLEGGLGDVVSKNNHFWVGYSGEKMQAIRHANGRDWWVLVHSISDIDTAMCFIRFLFTPDTIEGPFYQCYPPVELDGIKLYGSIGQMKFSQDGSRLAFTRDGYLEIYDFDRCTGLVSNMRSVENLFSGFYGCEFSADGRMIYTTDIASISTDGYLHQYCIDCPEPIAETRVTIYKNEVDDYTLGQLQIGPDGKIYVPILWKWLPNDVYSAINGNLSVINNPGEAGLSCDFDALIISLEGTRVTFGLPNMPNYNLGALAGSPCDTLLAIDPADQVTFEIKAYPNPARETLKIAYSPAGKILAIKTFNYLGEELPLIFDEILVARVSNIPTGFYTTVIYMEKNSAKVSWEKL
ncbi:MAG TPA: hypothetical protein DCF33_10385 [Saprospirales bacterium]|nr:hypothetical protein [Saprospirales bacterium]